MSPEVRARRFSRAIDSSIDIDAPPQKVWDALLDLPRWAEWNAFIPSVKGALEVGQKVKVKVVPPGRKPFPFAFPAEVRVVRPFEEIVWGGGFLGFVYQGDHGIWLERLPDGGTRFRQRERMRGPLVLLNLALGLLAPTKLGYDQMNEALKQRVEAFGAIAGRPPEPMVIGKGAEEKW